MVSAQLYGMPAQAHLAFSWVPWGTHEKQGVPRDVSKDPPTANLANLFFVRGDFLVRGDFVKQKRYFSRMRLYRELHAVIRLVT